MIWADHRLGFDHQQNRGGQDRSQAGIGGGSAEAARPVLMAVTLQSRAEDKRLAHEIGPAT